MTSQLHVRLESPSFRQNVCSVVAHRLFQALTSPPLAQRPEFENEVEDDFEELFGVVRGMMPLVYPATGSAPRLCPLSLTVPVEGTPRFAAMQQSVDLGCALQAVTHGSAAAASTRYEPRSPLLTRTVTRSEAHVPAPSESPLGHASCRGKE